MKSPKTHFELITTERAPTLKAAQTQLAATLKIARSAFKRTAKRSRHEKKHTTKKERHEKATAKENTPRKKQRALCKFPAIRIRVTARDRESRGRGARRGLRIRPVFISPPAGG